MKVSTYTIPQSNPVRQVPTQKTLDVSREIDALGINYTLIDFAATSKNEPVKYSVYDKYQELDKLQLAAIELLPKAASELGNCGKVLHPRAHCAEIRKNKWGKTYYSGLYHCERKWVCARCAAKEALKQKFAVLNAAQTHMVSSDNAKLVLITYTVQHSTHTPLEKSLNALKQAKRDMNKNRAYKKLKERYGILGNITSLEVSWTPSGQFHPHHHELNLIETDIETDSLLEALKREISILWQNNLARLGMSADCQHGVQVGTIEPDNADYIVKGSLAKGKNSLHISQWEMLANYADGDELAGDAFVEFVTAIRGSQAVMLTDYVRYDLDTSLEQSSIDDDDASENETVIKLSKKDYKAILKNDAHIEVLIAAGTSREKATQLLAVLRKEESQTFNEHYYCQ